MTTPSLGFRLRRVAVDMVRRSRRLRLDQTAASLAFLSLFAAVPVLSIALSVLSSLPVFDRLREALQQFLARNLFPDAFSDTLMRYLNEFASHVGGLPFAGALIFLATAITSLQMIERTMNAIWTSQRRRSLARRIGLYWALLTLGPLGIAAVLTANGVLISEFLSDRELAWLRSIWVAILPWLICVASLLLIFRSLPAARVQFIHALLGALLSAGLLSLLQRLLGWGIRQLPTYEIVYGAFAVLPLLLVWLFCVWGAVLSGALFAASLRRWDAPVEDSEFDDTPGRCFTDALVVLQALRDAGSNAAVSTLAVEQLRGRFDGDVARIEQAGDLLERKGYIVRFVSLSEASRTDWLAARDESDARRRRLFIRRDRVWEERWAWAQSPTELTLRSLFNALWWADRPAEVQAWQGKVLDVPLSELQSP